MEILQWLFIIGVSITIISIIFVFYFLISLLIQNRKSLKVKSKQRNLKRQKKEFNIKRKKYIKNIFFSILSIIIFGILSIYVSYYQSTNLSADDMTNISDGFYYLRDLKGELENIKLEDMDKSKQSINFIVTSLAGYSVKKANTFNTTEGQRILNKYYNAMAELGINISKNSTNILTDEEILLESLSDLNKVQVYQKEVLEFYKIDVSILESQK